MKRIIFALSLIAISFIGAAQEAGYRTTDVGGSFQYSPDFNTYSLQLAFNAEEYHSFILKGNFARAGSRKTSNHTSESGSGWGAYLGYRYHFSVIPKRAFLGLGVGIQSMKMNWSLLLLEGTTNLTLLQPTIEAGYTLLINDYMYITPSVSGILQTKLSSKGADVDFGSGFAPAAGISIGWRF